MPRALYEPRAAPPFAPPEVLARRLGARCAPPDGRGCQLWQGAYAAGAVHGVMRIKTPTGSALLPVHKVAWWLAGNGWADPRDRFRRSCGNTLCCTVDHLRHIPIAQVRRLSDDQVIEARRVYWAQGERIRNRLSRASAADPAQHTAWHLGLARATVERVVAGERVMPHLWRCEASPEEVRQVYADKVAECSRLNAGRQDAINQQALAERFGVSLGTMCRAINGTSYQHLPMPTKMEAAER